MNQSWPKLRDEVRSDIASSDGAGSIADPVFQRRIRLDAKAMALISTLRGAGGSTDELAERLGADPERLAPVLHRLMALDLLDSPRARARVSERIQLESVSTTPGKSLKPMPWARFGCTMCGSCCGGHNVGPVSPQILEGLAEVADDLENDITRERFSEKGLFFGLPTGPRESSAMCHAASGSCVFLDDGGRCRIHARLGGDKKPLPCRVFPWELVVTPTGVRVAVQRECRDFSAATAGHQPLISEACTDGGEVETLVNALASAGGLPSAKPIPVLRGAELDTWADYERLEDELLGVVASGTDSNAILAGLVTTLSPGHGPARDAFIAWRKRFLERIEAILSEAPPPDAHRIIRVDSLEALGEALALISGWVLSRALAPLEGPAFHLFTAHLRHAIWSCALARAPSIEKGLARLISEWLLARVLAISRARTAKRFHVTRDDLQDGLTLVSFLYRHDDLAPILADLDDLAVTCFVDGFLEFAASAPTFDAPDARLELVKF
jgi:Fe-S-cluster containining protein